LHAAVNAMPRFPALSLFSILLLAAACAATADRARSRENPGYEELTETRLATLPAGERAPWLDYLRGSQELAAADLAVLAAERTSAGAASPAPAEGTPRRLTISRPDAWFASPEARDLAMCVLSYQTPAGGWNKANPYIRPRVPGEEFGRERRYRGTFDNRATITELRFLARVIAATPASERAAFVAAFEKGLAYIFAAQFPNGGWPQVYPLVGDYHDALTFNDDAFVNLLELLRDVTDGAEPFAFVRADLKAEAARALERAHACLVASQVRREGRPTGWGQQHDALTLHPCAARAYEMASLSTSESAGIVRYLLTLPSPSPEIVAAIEGAAAWFEQTALNDVAYRDADGKGRRLVPAPGEGPLWARMIDLGTNRPVFGDRDYSVHASLDAVSEERRRGYAWYTDRPEEALKEFARWRAQRSQGRE
jgi:PelA/Pel-15E family pectate lyase